MAADKRSVATDALETLGTIISETEKRDAIHLAVEPVIAGEDLEPGDHVSLIGGQAYSCGSGDGLGIVDPFLIGGVPKGERFWFVVYPRKITSLRHVWEHPAFPPSTELAQVSDSRSLRYLKDFAEDLGISLQALLDGARDFLAHGSYLRGGDRFEGVYAGEEFWDHFEKVTGITVRDEDRESFFSCAC